jgi:hypothetical protein
MPLNHRSALHALLAVACFSFAIVLSTPAQQAPSPSNSEDHALVTAVEKHDKNATATLLSDNLIWTTSSGTTLHKPEVLNTLNELVLSDAAKPHAYGNVAYFTGASSVGAEKIRFVRVWVKQGSAWKLLLYQQTKILGTKAAAQATVPAGTTCENPCKQIPYTAPSAEAQAVVASWEALEDAVNHRNADGWAAHVADEFVFNVKEDGNPLTKADRVATIRKQAEGDTVTDIGSVIQNTMHVWLFGDTAVMSDQQQPTQGGNPYQAMRIWIKRDGRWQLLYSQQTVIEGAASTK